jgi:hypothetical protein
MRSAREAAGSLARAYCVLVSLARVLLHANTA